MSLLTHWEGEPVGVLARLWGVPEVEAHDRIGSTNDRLRERCREGGAPWTVVVADEQTRGRGRSGETWHSPPGAGLWLSVLVPTEAPPPASLPLRVGVAVARALEEAAGAPVGIKWPNDLVMGEGKVAGILCEGTGQGVVVGIGVNVRTPEGGWPAELRSVAVAAEEVAGKPISRRKLAGGILVGVRRLQAAGARDRLAPGEMDELRARDVLRDRRLVTTRGEGTGRGIHPSGALLLERADGAVERVTAGSVRTASW